MNDKLYLAIVFLLIASYNGQSNGEKIQPETDVGQADVYRTPCELIESRNFICDEHWVTTADGYILSVQHIINPVYLSTNKSTIKPVVLAHGLFGSATHFLINSEGGFADDWTDPSDINDDLNIEGRNLPYLMANLGYDVWIPNSRGNQFSKNHTSLDPDHDPAFWQFSFDEMIAFDTPAIIDYVLKQTGYNKLAWIGHSQGSMVLFGLLSINSDYSEKIEPFISLAPITHVGHITSPVRYIAKIPFLKKLVTLLGGELYLPKTLIDLFADKVCEVSVVKDVCSSIFYIFGGYDPDQFNTTRLPVYIAQGFCATSWWNLVHYGQAINSDKFCKFDLGWIGNYNRYGSLKPPEYDLGAVDLKSIVLIYGANDPLADPTDIETLRKSLKVPFIEYSVADPKYTHLDFIWGSNVYHQVYQPMIKILQKFD